MNTITKTAIAICVMLSMQPAGVAEVIVDAGKAMGSDTSSVLSSNNGSESKGRTPEKREKAASHNLRCWQYGRLIFEEAIAAIPADVVAAGVPFRGKGDDKSSVYLLDTKSGATCLVK